MRASSLSLPSGVSAGLGVYLQAQTSSTVYSLSVKQQHHGTLPCSLAVKPRLIPVLAPGPTEGKEAT